jgi:hypothetical protein
MRSPIGEESLEDPREPNGTRNWGKVERPGAAGVEISAVSPYAGYGNRLLDAADSFGVTDGETLEERLSSWSVRNGGYKVVQEIALSGPRGTELLAEEMRLRPLWVERLYLAAALGYGSGDAGVQELRSAAKETGPHTMDLRCASLLALAKRVGADSTQDFALALSDRTGAVRDYAMMCLAAVGNGSAYEVVFLQFRSQRKKRTKQPLRLMDAVVYLLRTTRLDRILELRDLLSEGQPHMHPMLNDVLLELWPDAADGQPVSEDDAERARAFAWSWFVNGRDALFEHQLSDLVTTYS